MPDLSSKQNGSCSTSVTHLSVEHNLFLSPNPPPEDLWATSINKEHNGMIVSSLLSTLAHLLALFIHVVVSTHVFIYAVWVIFHRSSHYLSVWRPTVREVSISRTRAKKVRLSRISRLVKQSSDTEPCKTLFYSHTNTHPHNPECSNSFSKKTVKFSLQSTVL